MEENAIRLKNLTSMSSSSRTMKALRKLKRGPGNVEVVDIIRPSIQEGMVIVGVQRTGVCGTDVHILHDLFPRVRPPVTLGHEFCGVVVEIGPNVQSWKVGDRVTVDCTASFCGVCPFCQSGQTQLCDQRLGLGSSRDGGFASFVSVRQETLHRLPDHISFQEGALCEPLACATHALMEMSSTESGNAVLVTGPGTIGLLVLQVAKAVGATVFVTGTQRDEERLQLAIRMGADHCIQIDQQNLVPLILDFTNRYGVDVAFECSGAINALKDCISCVRKGGEIVQVGLFGQSVELNYDEITFKEIRIKGSYAHNRGSWEKAIDLLRNRKVDLNSLVTKEFPLNRWDEAFKLFEEGVGLKYLLFPID
jgi:L-iditol 2-dehydrogenase